MKLRANHKHTVPSRIIKTKIEPFAASIMYWILFLLEITATLGCWYYGDTEPPYYNQETPAPNYLSTLFLKGEKGDAVNRNLKAGYGGFKAPHEVEQLWRYWLLEHNKQLELEKEREKNGEGLFNRGPGSGWPERWMGLGNGQGGVAPPPWAYVPLEGDLPAFCYLPPETGSCNQSLSRYGFNPYSQQCETFNYSGCDENQNNFKKKETCEVACMPMPIAGCELDTMQYIEEED